MKWTDEQRNTIEARGCNILVSAAAGSGKTAVLVERIRQLATGVDSQGRVCGEPVPVSRMLIVTFTNAAASEMKDKIYSALSDAAAGHPEMAGDLKKQLESVKTADISTFHSFALEVIRRYFYLADIDPGFGICDDAQSTMMKAEAADQVFSDFFNESSSRFIDFLRSYGGTRDETALKETLIDMYDRIQAMPDPMEWLKGSVDSLGVSSEEFLSSHTMEQIWRCIDWKLDSAYEAFGEAEKILECSGLEKLAARNRMDIDAVAEMKVSAADRDHEKLRKLVLNFAPQQMRAAKDEKEDFGPVSEIVRGFRDTGKNMIRKDLREKYFAMTLEEYTQDMRATRESGIFFAEMTEAFRRAYAGIKREKNLIDFSDIEHYAIDILRDPLVSGEYREKFLYIFVDEYQDSNYLQEEIINSVKRENNVFMVGDVKQSIYKFRLAEPEIFRGKYHEYAMPENENSIKIDLNMNFRSRRPVIRAVNHIFSGLMEEYDDSAALHAGLPDSGEGEPEVELHITDGASSYAGDGDDATEELGDMKRTELEAMTAAGIISDSLGKDFYDPRSGIKRELKKKDIVILMRGVRNKAEIFYEILAAAGIDTYIDDNSGYFDTLEIISFTDLLRVIDNSRQDIPLIGVLRSHIFGFSTDELIRVRTAFRDTSYRDALVSYADAGEDDRLRAKISNFLDRLDKWKKESVYMPVDEFSWKIMDETGTYAYYGALPGGTLRQANLRIFVDKASAFRKNGGGTIYGLLRYIDVLKEKKIDMGQADIMGEGDDTVRIMTVHKSKGLEFPMVILASIGGRFNFDSRKKRFAMHKDLGIGIPRVDHEGHWFRNTITGNAIADRKRTEETEEEVRILYVAMTRAVDRLVLLGSDPSWHENEEKYENGMKKESSYLGMIYPFISDSDIKVTVHDRKSLGEHAAETAYAAGRLDALFAEDAASWHPENDPLYSEIDRRLSWQYGDLGALRSKSKYSASELNGGQTAAQETEMPALDVPAFIDGGGKRRFSSAEKGTIMHLIMEHLDFTRMNDSIYSGNFIRDMVKNEILTPEEAGTADIGAIRSFAQSDIGRRAEKAAVSGRLFRETPFNILHDVRGTEAMVQGIIDCWFEEEGGIVLLDYKTDRNSIGIEEKYREQIGIYRCALESGCRMKVKEAYLYLFSEGKTVEIKDA